MNGRKGGDELIDDTLKAPNLQTLVQSIPGFRIETWYYIWTKIKSYTKYQSYLKFDINYDYLKNLIGIISGIITLIINCNKKIKQLLWQEIKFVKVIQLIFRMQRFACDLSAIITITSNIRYYSGCQLNLGKYSLSHALAGNRFCTETTYPGLI